MMNKTTLGAVAVTGAGAGAGYLVGGGRGALLGAGVVLALGLWMRSRDDSAEAELAADPYAAGELGGLDTTGGYALGEPAIVAESAYGPSASVPLGAASDAAQGTGLYAPVGGSWGGRTRQWTALPPTRATVAAPPVASYSPVMGSRAPVAGLVWR